METSAFPRLGPLYHRLVLSLVDEPGEGLALLVLKALPEAIIEIKEAGVTMFVAGQNLGFCRKIADRGYIIERGGYSITR